MIMVCKEVATDKTPSLATDTFCLRADMLMMVRSWTTGRGTVQIQAGATWLVEMEVCVLEEAVVEVSSSPNGFFPQHTVVIIQFLN